MTPPSQPTELDNAVEAKEKVLVWFLKEPQQLNKELSITVAELKLFVDAAKRAQELDKENEILSESCCGLEMERTKLRDDLKQAMIKMNIICAIPREGRTKYSDSLTGMDKFIALPSVQDALKDK